MQPIDPALLSDGSSTDPEDDEEEDELDGLITIEKESAQGKELRLRTVAKALFDEIDQDDSGVSCPCCAKRQGFHSEPIYSEP